MNSNVNFRARIGIGVTDGGYGDTRIPAFSGLQ